MQNDFIEHELVILSKATIDSFLKKENASDLIALYIFYYYTAKWQKTNQIKATTGYTAKGLGWGDDRVIRNKKELIIMGLVEDVQEKSGGKIEGWYIKIKYLWKENTVQQSIHPRQVPEGGSVQRVEIKGTNALSVNRLNALNNNNGIAVASPQANSEGWDGSVVEPDDELVPTGRIKRKEAIKNGYKGHLTAELRKWAENRVGNSFRFTNRSVQDASIARMLSTFSVEDIKKKWSDMEVDPYWSTQGFDFKDVGSQINKFKSNMILDKGPGVHKIGSHE